MKKSPNFFTRLSAGIFGATLPFAIFPPWIRYILNNVPDKYVWYELSDLPGDIVGKVLLLLFLIPVTSLLLGAFSPFWAGKIKDKSLKKIVLALPFLAFIAMIFITKFYLTKNASLPEVLLHALVYFLLICIIPLVTAGLITLWNRK